MEKLILVKNGLGRMLLFNLNIKLTSAHTLDKADSFITKLNDQKCNLNVRGKRGTRFGTKIIIFAYSHMVSSMMPIKNKRIHLYPTKTRYE